MHVFKVFVLFAVIVVMNLRLSYSENDVKFPGSQFEIPPSKEKLEAGRKALTEIESEAQHSQCWKNAVINIHTGCKKLTDMEQSYLAIDFANCHLEKSGRQIYPCTRQKTVKECTRSMDDTAFNTYTTFFTHTSNICFFLQSQAWQERTERTVTKLSSTSEEVASQLEDSLKNQLEVLQHQNKSLVNQKKILQHEHNLTETLASSTVDAKKAFEEMKERAHEQRALFSETFDAIFKKVESIKQLQSMILGEFISLQSLAFHIVAVCVCYFFTSTPRTAGARLLLFIGLAVLIGVERMVTSWSVGKEEQMQSELVHGRLWLCRKLFIFVAMVILVFVAMQYKDYSKINHNMLMEIRNQIREIQAIRQADNEKGLKAITNGEQAGSKHPESGKAAEYRKSESLLHQSTHGLAGRLSFYDVTDACSSVEANTRPIIVDDDDDPTFIPGGSQSQVSESDDDSSETDGEVSHISSPQPSDHQLKTPTVKTRPGRATPLRTSTPRKNRTGPRSTPRQSPSPSHSYNLRPRRSNTSSPYMHSRSFMEGIPSPSTLRQLIDNLKDNPRRRYSAVIKKSRDNRNSNSELFSSDEEI